MLGSVYPKNNGDKVKVMDLSSVGAAAFLKQKQTEFIRRREAQFSPPSFSLSRSEVDAAILCAKNYCSFLVPGDGLLSAASSVSSEVPTINSMSGNTDEPLLDVNQNNPCQKPLL